MSGKFIQIAASTEGALYALDVNGDVWIYDDEQEVAGQTDEGSSPGVWRPLSQERAGLEEAEEEEEQP